MAHDERNFRSAYYEKVGFRSAEEKKSLEILLKDKPLDKAKLKQFCLRFSVPSTYRNFVWKVLLDVVPIFPDAQTFVMDQKNQEYKELLRALHTMRVVETNTPKPLMHYSMWVLHTGNLHFDTHISANNVFIMLTQSFSQFFEDDVDIYWLTKCFLEHKRKYTSDYPKLIECTWSLLEKEDLQLYKHLEANKIFNLLPLNNWFDCCFAGILIDTALGRIWDKICAGSCKILVYVVIALLINQRHKLIKCKDIKSALECFKRIPEETAEVIANKSIEMWQQHGSLLTVHDKPKS